MPFDIFTMAAIRDEMAERVVGGRIDKVIQPSALSIAFNLWAGRRSQSILISADSRHARAYLASQKLAKGFETPSPFLMLLRKHCGGGRIEKVRQAHLERVLFLDVTTHERTPVTLVAEIMGNRSNIILLDDEAKILGAVKLVGSRQSRVRRILPHVSYMLPPPQRRAVLFDTDGEKVDPLAEDGLGEIRDQLAAASPDTAIGDALVGLLRGCSPSIARDIALRAGCRVDDALASVSVENLLKAIRDQFSLLLSGGWSPIVVLKDVQPADYRAYDSPPIAGSKRVESMSLAVEEVSAGLESKDALQSGRQRLRALVSGRRRELEGKRASLRQGLEQAGKAGELRNAGDMILGYQYSLEPGASQLDVPETGISIRLDPKLTTVENAEAYFKRYRKAREAGKRVPQLLESTERDLAFVDDLDAYVDLAETPQDLSRVEAELMARFGGGGPAKKKPISQGKPLIVDVGQGHEALVGRNARQNEEVTFRLAGRRDLWFHARDVPGSHVVLRGFTGDAFAGRDQEDPSVTSAASLAAYYSRARQESAVDVIVTRVRDVHRLTGGGPGQVTYRNGRTVRVRPRGPDSVAGQ